ncbi:MAG: hypothetical protein EOO68_33605, partial [Moraxellaceae bacterium]
MPIHSRLLRLLIIVATTGFSVSTWAINDAKPAKNQSPSMSAAETSNGELPFDNRDIPKATSTITIEEPASAAATKSTTSVNQSRTESRQTGANQCSSTENNALQKSLLVTAFPRLNPGSSNAGTLN